MGTFDLLPVADWRNEGWSLVGSAVTTLTAAWNNDDDTKYAKSPASKGRGEVTFPVDTSSVPEGAVIDSITVHLRCAKVGAGTPSVTVSVLPSDNEALFTSRTIQPTATPFTFEVARYFRDPLGYEWDVHRLNKLRCRVFSWMGLFDVLRCYKFYCKVHYHTRPTVAITGPTGTVRTPSPTIEWVYTHSEGDQQSKTDYRIFTTAQIQSASFNPDTTSPVYSTTVNGDVSSEILPTSLNPDSYTVYLRSHSVYKAKSKWVSRSFEIQGPAPAPPGNDDADISGVPGVGTVSVVPDNWGSAVYLTMRDASNLLSVQQSDFETTTDPFEWVGTNCDLSRETVNVYSTGIGSQKVTTTVAGAVQTKSVPLELAPSTPITVRAQVRAAVTARTVSMKIEYFDSEYQSLGAATTLDTDTDDPNTWKELTASTTTHASAVYTVVTLEWTGTALSEVHYADRTGVMYGTGSAWSHGGHYSRNLLSGYVATADVLPGAGAATAFLANNSGTTVTRTVTSGWGAHGTHKHRMTYAGVTPSIGFRATGSNFTSPTSGNDFTLNAPVGVTDSDLMLAFVTTTTPSTITPPSGWVLVNSTSADNDNGLYILARTSTVGDPATWAGTFSSLSTRRTAFVIAWSGAANASDPFVAESVRADADGNPVHTSASVNNTIANSWRVGCFVARDDTGSGVFSANVNPPVIPPDPEFVGCGAKWSRSNTATDYTINRPAGVQSGDFMLAGVLSNGAPTINAASGWTLVRRVAQSESGWSSNSVTLSIFKRTAGSSEPSSWSGTFSSSQGPVIVQSVAYRNCKDASLQFIVENGSTDNSGTDITTALVNNTSSKSLRVSMFGSNSDNAAMWTSTESFERADDYQSTSGKDVSLAVFDSGTTVSTGNHSRVGYTTQSFYGAVSWIGLIVGLDTIPSPVADETERREVINGSSDPWITTAVYDSNGVVGTGSSSLTGSFTGGTTLSTLSWIGLIKPAAPVVQGDASAKLAEVVDISTIDAKVFDLAGNKISTCASFMGSASGTPYLTLDFYRANQLISSATAEGSSFGTATWTKSGAVFGLPEGTTRVGMSVSVRERAVSDTVSFDRLSIALGESLVWRNGTGRDEHPVWSHPEIQYADDNGTGYGDWKDLPGLKLSPPEYDPLTGLVAFVDHTAVPLHRRRYRSRTVSYGLAGDRFISAWGPDSSEVQLTAANWWLKDISDPSQNLRLEIQWEPTQVSTKGTSSEFYPMGSDRPVVVTDGYKGDSFELTAQTRTSEEFARLTKLVKSGKTLLLQSDVDHAWWVRLVGDIGAGIEVTSRRKEKPFRRVALRFVEVQPEE